jgi:outer membrane protein assembly factor BamB
LATFTDHRRRIARTITCFALVSLLLTACGGDSNSTTPTKPAPTVGSTPTVRAAASPIAVATGQSFERADTARTGAFAGPVPLTAPQLLWTAEVGDEIGNAPVVAGGIVYAPADDLRAFDVASGALLWTTSIDLATSPAISAGVLFVGGRADGVPTILALDALTGQERWRAAFKCATVSSETYCSVRSAPIVVNDFVIAATPADLVALDATTGAERWRVAGRAIFGSPAFAGGSIVVRQQREVIAIDPANGQQLWSTDVAEVGGGPVLSHFMVIVDTGEKKHLIALNESTGAEAWNVSLDGYATEPAIAGDLLIVATRQSEQLIALDVVTGQERWKIDLDDRVYGSPIVAGNVVLLTADDRLLAFDAATGAELWSLEIAKFTTASLTIANGVIYLVSKDEQLYAYGL